MVGVLAAGEGRALPPLPFPLPLTAPPPPPQPANRDWCAIDSALIGVFCQSERQEFKKRFLIDENLKFISKYRKKVLTDI